jgi:molybdenum cofactor guanylyltransferase
VSAAGFVLAGGKSSRMGRDKALVELGGKPLIVWTLEALRGAGLQPRIAGARSYLSAFAPVIPDREPDAGPLEGICAALEETDAELAVFLTVDMPLVPALLIGHLLRDAAKTGRMATLVSLNGVLQTFPAVVRRAALPSLEDELRNGKAGCLAGFEAAARGAGEPVRVIAVEELGQAGDPALWLHNVNSELELARVEQWLSSQIPKCKGFEAPDVE